jgi:hypothetical protein
MSEIDWSILDGDPECTIYCQCGAVYRSHFKAKMADDGLHQHTRKPCPQCQRSVDHARRVSSDPERMTIGRKP